MFPEVLRWGKAEIIFMVFFTTKKIFLNKVTTKKIVVVSAVIFPLIITLFYLLFWQASQQIEKNLAESLTEKQTTTTAAGVKTVNNLLDSWLSNLLLLAEIESVKTNSKEGQVIIAKLIDSVIDKPLSGIVRVNKEGKTIWSDNPDHKPVQLGLDLSDRDYFTWAKEQTEPGSIYISDPVVSRGGVNVGKWIVIMAAPVFVNNKFDGLVFISFLTENLANDYLEPLVFNSKLEYSVVNNRGVVIVSRKAAMLGENIFTYYQDIDWEGKSEFISSVRSALIGNDIQAMVDRYDDSTGIVRKYVATYRPFRVNNQTWFFCTCVPYENVNLEGEKLQKTQTDILVFFIVSLYLILIVFLLTIRIAKVEGYVKGVRQGYKAKAK